LQADFSALMAGLAAAWLAMDKLREIIAHKRQEIAPVVTKSAALRETAAGRVEFRSLEAALRRDASTGLGLIAEVKKASPSAGMIAADVDPVAQALRYAAAGASGISVLTDERFFKGRLDYLTRIRQETPLPVLRKDFIIHPAQIFEAAAAGADAVLLIVAALEQEDLLSLLETAREASLESLVEVHDEAEMERALATPARLIGVNNRSLHTFEVDIETTRRLSAMVTGDRMLVSESGIKGAREAAMVKSWGARAVLVGEALMRDPDPESLARAIMRAEEAAPEVKD